MKKNMISVEKIKQTVALLVFTTLSEMTAFAQDGKAGIQKANTQVRDYFDVGTDLMYAVGAVLGLIGAVKV